MKSHILWFTGFLLSACTPNLNVTSLVQVACARDVDCPKGFSCGATAGRCFEGSPDSVSPRLLSATAESALSVVLAFDEPIYEPFAVTIDGLEVTSHSFRDAQRVMVATTPQQGGQNYVASAKTLDAFGNALAPEAASTVFLGFGAAPDRSAPTLFTPSNDTRSTEASVTFAWSTRIRASQYRLVVSTSEDLLHPIAGSPFVTEDTSLTLQLSDDLTYYWTVESDVQSSAGEVRAIHRINDRIYVGCVNATACAETVSPNSGTRNRPLHSVSVATSEAQRLQLNEVAIAETSDGSSYQESSIIVSRGIALRGGYSSDFLERDPVLHPTSLVGSGAQTIQVVAPNGPVIISGLRIVGGTGAGGAIFAVDCADYLTVEDSELRGGVLSGGIGYTFQALDGSKGCNPVLQNNEVLGPQGEEGSSSVAISLVGTNAILRNNQRIGGGSGQSVTAIEIRGGRVLLEDNPLIVATDSSSSANAVALTIAPRVATNASTGADVTIRRSEHIIGRDTTSLSPNASAIQIVSSRVLLEDCPDIRTGPTSAPAGTTLTVSNSNGLLSGTEVTLRRSRVVGPNVASPTSGQSRAVRVSGSAPLTETDVVANYFRCEDSSLVAGDVAALSTSSSFAVEGTAPFGFEFARCELSGGYATGSTGVRTGAMTLTYTHLAVSDSKFYTPPRQTDGDLFRAEIVRLTAAAFASRASFLRNEITGSGARLTDPASEAAMQGLVCINCSGEIRDNQIRLNGNAYSSEAIQIFMQTAIEEARVLYLGNNDVLAAASHASMTTANPRSSIGLSVRRGASPNVDVVATNNTIAARVPDELAATYNAFAVWHSGLSTSLPSFDLTNNVFAVLTSVDNPASVCIASQTVGASVGLLPRSVRHNAFINCPTLLSYTPPLNPGAQANQLFANANDLLTLANNANNIALPITVLADPSAGELRPSVGGGLSTTLVGAGIEAELAACGPGDSFADAGVSPTCANSVSCGTGSTRAAVCSTQVVGLPMPICTPTAAVGCSSGVPRCRDNENTVGLGSSGCGNVTHDREGTRRTCNSPTSCYSIGAYEIDL